MAKANPPAAPSTELHGIDGLPAQQALEALLPSKGPDFVLAYLLAAFRRDARGWLGARRSAVLENILGDDSEPAFNLLDRAPRPPALLGDASQWLGCRVPLLHRNRIIWTELFWRPDRAMAERGAGSFAFRMQLPSVGQVEIRGRMEEFRLDAMMHAEKLPKAIAFDIKDHFQNILTIMNMVGVLTVNS
jgi:hypothetical protein